MSWLGAPLFGFDLETTGTDPATARLVTAAIVRFDGAEETATRNWLVNPGLDIPVEATAVHGITTEHAVTHGMSPEIAMQQLVGAFAEVVDYQGALVGHNIAYDLTVMHHELLRVGFAAGIDALALPSVIDTIVIDKQTDKYRKGKRTLIGVSDNYDVALANAHAADADARAAVLVARAIGKKYPDIAELDAKELHAMQITWKKEQAADLQSFLRSKGRADAVIDARWPVAS